MGLEAAAEFIRKEAVQRAWRRGFKIFFLSVAGPYVLSYVLPVFQSPWSSEPISVDQLEHDGARMLSEVSAVFSLSFDPVVPSLVAALFALAVVNAVGLGPRFIIGAANLIAGIAIVWAYYCVAAAVLQPFGLQDGAPARAVGAVTLGLVAVLVAVVISEMSEAAEHTRAEDRQRDLRALNERADSASTGAAAQLTESGTARPVQSRLAARFILLVWGVACVAASAIVGAVAGREETRLVLVFVLTLMLCFTLTYWLVAVGNIFRGGLMSLKRKWIIPSTLTLVAIIWVVGFGRGGVVTLAGVVFYLVGAVALSLAATLPTVRLTRGRFLPARMTLTLVRASLTKEIGRHKKMETAIAAMNPPLLEPLEKDATEEPPSRAARWRSAWRR